jgi:hypothetical protein
MKQPVTVGGVENRAEMKVTAMLIGRHGKLGSGKGNHENVSSRGIRVISKDERIIDDLILIALPAGHFASAARVAYRDAFGHGRFGAGLEFVGSSECLEMLSFALPPGSPQA